MACGDVTPSTVYLPTCGLETVRITKSSTPPDGSLILPGDEITWSFLIESQAEGPPGITFEDIFDDCEYLTDVAVITPGWTLTADGDNPCRYIIENPAAVHPSIYVVKVVATAGTVIPEDVLFEGFGTLVNTANLLVPVPSLGGTVELIFGPLLRGDVEDQNLGGEVEYQYQIASGTGPFVISLYLGELPDGLTLTPDGLLSGTTTVAGDFSFVLQLLDANGNTYLLSDECVVTSVSTIVSGEDEGIEALSIDIPAIAMV